MTKRTFGRAPAATPLLLKAALPELPVIGRLPGVRHHGTTAPDLTLVREGVRSDVRHLQAYNELCGFPRGTDLPPTYPHVPAFALHMALMTDTAFPFNPMGLVHLRNRLTQVRPIGIEETYDLTVEATDLRPHPKGRLIDLHTHASVGHETVWTEVTTLFSRGRGRGPEESPPALDGVDAPEGIVQWRLPADLGRRYGAVSGDRNPIHLHPLTAKPFGFASNIAHGMWTTARSLAALVNRLHGAFTVDVEFRKPILLPSTVVFGSRVGGDGIVFGVTSPREPGSTESTTHVVGKVVPA